MRERGKVACIGWRGCPPAAYPFLEDIGAFVVRQGFVLATGNARGPDQAFARGGNRVDPSRVHLYLPWPSFNRHRIHPGNHLVCHFDDEELPGGSWEQPLERDFLRWAQLARDAHPYPHRLKDGSRMLLTRNVGIVEGANQVLAARNPDDHERGGTNHAWRVAQFLSITCIDVASDEGAARIRAKLAA